MKTFILSLLLFTSNSYALYQERMVVPIDTFPKVHGSSVVALPQGKLLSCFFAGSREGARDVEINCSHFDGNKWLAPVKVVKRQDRSRGTLWPNDTVGNTVLHLDKQNRLWLFYVSRPLGGWAMSRINYKVSLDFGQTWTKGRKLTRGIGKLARNKLIELDNGQFILPFYHEVLKTQGMLCVGTPKKLKLKISKCKKIKGNHHIQPSILKDPKTNTIHVYMRNMKKDNLFYTSFELNPKRRFKFKTVEKLHLPNPNSSIDSIMVDDKYSLLVFNNSKSERTPLSIGISSDFKNFNVIYNIETSENRFSYPTLIKDQKGIFHLVYSYKRGVALKHVSFDLEGVNATTTTQY